jgi:hypothetical protein
VPSECLCSVAAPVRHRPRPRGVSQLRKLRKQLSYANVMSSIAVFVVLGGGAYAATTLPKNSVGSRQLKANAVSSGKVKDGSLLSKDFKPGQLVAGAPGPTGSTGPAGPTGPKGETGPKGDKGADFTADTSLASGKTLKGQWSALGHGGGYLGAAVTYRLPLAATPAAASAHYITGSSFTAQCPGVGEAAGGELCIYEAGSSSALFGVIYAVEPASTATNRGSKDGFQIQFTTSGTSNAYAYGTWATTAP